VDQIRQDEDDGRRMGGDHRLHRGAAPPDHADRCAAILAMIPLDPPGVLGPMAVSIMGGLVVATLLTCLFLPALICAWFRVREI